MVLSELSTICEGDVGLLGGGGGGGCGRGGLLQPLD